MVQGNRDIEQDVKDILATRDELTEKVELLRGQIRVAVWQTQHKFGRSMDQVKETVNGVRRIFNPSHQLHGHPLAIVAMIFALRYFLRQLRKKDSPVPGQRASARWPKKTLISGKFR